MAAPQLKAAMLSLIRSKDLQCCFGSLGQPSYAWSFRTTSPVSGFLNPQLWDLEEAT